MPANLPPQYYEAEEEYRSASTPEEKIAALNEMLAIMPKHKGTEKLQADLKKRISKLKEEKDKKSEGKSTYNPYKIDPEGAGQLILLGYPNTGKSSLLGALSNAKVTVANYPFSTSLPVAGMVPYENIQIQVIDTPPLVPEDVPGPMISAIQRADLPVVMISLASSKCLEQLDGTLEFLKSKRIVREPEDIPEGVKVFTQEDIIFIATGIDHPEAEDNLDVIKEFYPEIEFELVSVPENTGLKRLPELFFNQLGVIRIYSKAPGQEPDQDSPFVMPAGTTLIEFARAVHKDFAENLKKACVWGSSRFPGQPVAQDFILEDEDIVELHTSK